MARLMKDFVAEMLYEPPKRAEPKVFAYQLLQGYPIRMELTINDRGCYEHIVPMAKSEGRREGIKAGKDEVKRTIPYGFEPEQYYE